MITFLSAMADVMVSKKSISKLREFFSIIEETKLALGFGGYYSTRDIWWTQIRLIKTALFNGAHHTGICCDGTEANAPPVVTPADLTTRHNRDMSSIEKKKIKIAEHHYTATLGGSAVVRQATQTTVKPSGDGHIGVIKDVNSDHLL